MLLASFRIHIFQSDLDLMMDMWVNDQGALSLTWINFKPSMDKIKLQLCNHWSLEMET